MTRSRLLPLGLALAAYALAFAQRTGELAADTKIDLHTGAAGFLAEAAAAWSPSGGLGQVQAGQYTGYLWPMGPFHALGDVLGVAPWVTHRLWLGTLLAVAAWGTVRLLDALHSRERGAAHLVAGALVIANPYVVVFANRTSVTLLAYALLPWLLLCVHRGLREPRGWWWPAALALLAASLGGGVNAAVAGWVLLGPALLLAYEVAIRAVAWRDALRFLARALVLGVLASLWWMVPVAIQVGQGADFLPFTESAGAIWTSTSLSESLRLFGFWVSYLGIGYGAGLDPAFGSASAYLFDPWVIAGSFAVPGLAIGGYLWARRWRYGPFFLALLLLGLLVMAAGFPEGSPLRRALTYAYYRVELVQFLRTTYKAGPLAVIALACLGGFAAGELARRLRGRRLRAVAAGVLGAALLALSALPLLTGRAVDESIAFDEVPSDWRATAEGLDRELPDGTRAVVLPGQVFPYYRWGFTQDAILPALTDRPVAVRGVVPYADLRAVDLLWSTDALVQQRRVVPGQLGPLLDLMGAGAVVAGADDDRDLSGAVRPQVAAEQLAAGGATPGQPRRHGAVSTWLRSPAGPGLVRVHPRRAPLVVDGSAPALAGLAALGALGEERVLRYAADMDAGELRDAARAGGEIVVSDSNRRRAFLPSRPRQASGPTEPAGAGLSRDAAVLDPFTQNGTEAQTVAVLEGARSIEAPASPAFIQFPEHRPFAAFDGDPGTYWGADRYLDEERRWIEIDLGRAIDVPALELTPQRETATDIEEVEIAGRRHRIRPGVNRLEVGLEDVERLRVTITRVSDPPEDRPRGAGAIAEIAIPGVEVRERLRPPTVATSSLAAPDLASATLTYLFERTTGDDPFRRGPQPDPDAGSVAPGRNQETALIGAARDPEARMARVLRLPAERTFEADGWATFDPTTPDSYFDRLAGVRAPARYDSNGRYQGRPGYRASSAFDGTAATAWIAPRGPLRPELRVVAERPVDLRGMLIEPPRGTLAAAPTAVRITAGGRRTGVLPVSPAGEVDLPRPVRTRAFTIEVIETLQRDRPAVGIAEVRTLALEPATVPRSGRAAIRCGTLRARAGGEELRLGVRASIADVDDGGPLRARPCGQPARLPAGTHDLEVAEGPLLADILRLRSEPPGGAAQARATGAVVDPGSDGRGEREGVRLDLEEDGWLVLGESYAPGWRAECDGEDLGEPEPVDGYANGWRAPAGCREAAFSFEPQRAMNAGFAISGIAGLVLVALLVALPFVRRRRGPAAMATAPPRALADPGEPRALPPLRAGLIGLAAGILGAGLFSLRAGAVIAPLVALLLWRGAGARPLALAAGALTGLALPAIYVVFPPEDPGGFNSSYASELIGAHWVAVAVWVLLAVALSRAIPALRAGGRGDAGEGSAAP